MAVAMAALAAGALFAGLIQIPGVTDAVFRFLDPVFAGSPLAAVHASTGAEWVGLAIGAAITLAGIAVACCSAWRGPSCRRCSRRASVPSTPSSSTSGTSTS